MTLLSAALTTSGETPLDIATHLKEVSQSLKPSALSPHSAARADATPRIDAAASAKDQGSQIRSLSSDAAIQSRLVTESAF